MAFDWHGFFTLAQDLAARGDDAAKRTAISRAYYFIFNLSYARALTNCGAKPNDVSTHAWCWQKYKKTAENSCRALGIEGERLKRLRAQADYENADIPRLDAVCERVLADTLRFYTNFQALHAQYPRP
jgi:hypothetical protein